MNELDKLANILHKTISDLMNTNISCSLSGDVGVENKRIDPSSSIPVGFARGRVKKLATNIA